MSSTGINKNINFTILRIKTISFYVNEVSFQEGKDVKIEMNQNFGVSLAAEVIEYRLRVYLFHLDNPSLRLSEIIVHNSYKIENIMDYFSNDVLSLPSSLFISLLSMSISHSRALFCQNTAGTIYQDYILPIINPTDVAKVFYPNMFNKGEIKENIEFPLKELTPP
ncbi:MAG: hypothetical protein ABI707_12165 [Ferruginibacter sp.]